MNKINVAIIGSSGFTGSEICRILLQHNNVNKIYPVSREKKVFTKASKFDFCKSKIYYD